MAKIKLPKSSPAIDMTPLVDLGFLLVTFFMLTAQFRPEDSVIVDFPSSRSQLVIPTENLMTVVVDSTGRAYWDFTDKKVRREVLREMSSRYDVSFTPEQEQRFVSLGAIGMPMSQLPTYLTLENATERGQMDRVSKGIPMDSTNNQLLDWIRVTQLVFSSGSDGKNPIVALKGDGNVDYTVMNHVIKIFQSPTVKINRFRMITTLEESRLAVSSSTN